MEALADERVCERRSVREQGLCKRERRQDSVGRRWSVRSDKDDGRLLMAAISSHPLFHCGASAPIFQPHPPPILSFVVPQCACVLVLPHGSHTGTLGLPDGFWLSKRFGFPSAYSSPIHRHVVFFQL